MKNNNLLKIAPVLFGFFVMGFCDIVGISSDYAKDAFGWSYAMAGFVPSMVFVWFLFLGIPTGMVMNRIGRKNTVLVSMVVTIIGMMLPLFTYNSVTCMAAYAMLGIGNAILQVSLMPLLNNVISDARLLTSSLTAGTVVKALCSLAGPWVVTFAIAQFGGGDAQNWYLCFPILGGVTLFSALWLMATPIPREKADVSELGHAVSISSIVGDTLRLLKDRYILMLFFGIFFVVGIDVATNFISSKLMITRFSYTKEQAGIAPQVYFICRTIGAFAGVFLMTKIQEVKYYKLNILACSVIILVMAFVSNEWVNLACIGLIGATCACIFPIIYTAAMRRMPDKENLISGLLITAVAGGGAVTPLIGTATDTIGIAGGTLILLICGIYLTVCAYRIKQ